MLEEKNFYQKKVCLKDALETLDKMRNEYSQSFHDWLDSLESGKVVFSVEVAEEFMQHDSDCIHALNAVIGYCEEFLSTLDSDGSGFVTVSSFSITVID